MPRWAPPLVAALVFVPFTGDARTTVVTLGICALVVILTAILPGGSSETAFLAVIVGALAALASGWLVWRQTRTGSTGR